MKKIVCFISFCLVLFLSQSVFAAWTVDVSRSAFAGTKKVVRIEMTGDGTACSENIWEKLITQGVLPKLSILGHYVYRYIVDPDGTNPPGATYDITITDGFGDVATIADLSTTVTKRGLISNVTESSGYLGLYAYLLITCEDIGSGNKTVLFLELVE